MKTKIYFIHVENSENKHSVMNKIHHLYQVANLGNLLKNNDLVGLKIHFGENRNNTHISPGWVKPLITDIKKRGGNPFLTDTTVLYKSQRNNAIDHHHVAHQHGFTIENVGAPVIIGDGLRGRQEKEVSIAGEVYKKVSIAPVALEANSLLILSHVTGHLGSGLGGTIKNIGMGFASRKGKLRQHAALKPHISDKFCTGCMDCIQWCPVHAISIKNNKAWIDSKKCIGCGECLTICQFNSVKHDWGVSSIELQKRMAEHALGVVTSKLGKIGYLNFLISITKDCDCIDLEQSPVCPDIGIIAGTDPVAIDAASLNLIKKKTGKSLNGLSYPEIDPWIQIRHGEAIGLGTSEYELVVI